MSGPLAELAVEKEISRGLRQQLADAEAIADRRAREAYDDGLKHGRAAWPIGAILGSLIGAALTGLYFVLTG